MTSDISGMSGVSLAYIGDAIIELLIREALIRFGITDTGRLSAAAQKLVCAKTQSEIVETLLPTLSEEEAAAYRLGRNHHINSKPKKATVAEYSRATGLEAVFGYLHISGNAERVRSLFSEAYDPLLADIKEKI